jgi:hypothetical protein
MAKKSASGNKSAAIREALQANPDASPKEIAESLKAQGHKVTPAYVSIVKYNLSKASGSKGRKVRVKKAGRTAGVAGGHTGIGSGGFAPVETALDFIKACGGLEQAKQVLATVEQLRSAF